MCRAELRRGCAKSLLGVGNGSIPSLAAIEGVSPVGPGTGRLLLQSPQELCGRFYGDGNSGRLGEASEWSRKVPICRPPAVMRTPPPAHQGEANGDILKQCPVVGLLLGPSWPPEEGELEPHSVWSFSFLPDSSWGHRLPAQHGSWEVNWLGVTGSELCTQGGRGAGWWEWGWGEGDRGCGAPSSEASLPAPFH